MPKMKANELREFRGSTFDKNVGPSRTRDPKVAEAQGKRALPAKEKKGGK